ncbi:hypothetical protein BFL34_02031 [Clavibacter michiganensis]|uniref:Uncharacterized protein n=1 Tax=Clavibacter michiganensis TaxID=28447 RepID=A0A251Y779_9MICO|nr:hypothetical protein [Clavibacter michiganensis]OUE19888.1 hypothetical protein BFL34_02031 [Clavibacter michiganensis]
MDERRLVLRPRAGTGLRAVLVVDESLTSWWEGLVVADPDEAGPTLLHALAEAAADARPTERYVVRDEGRLSPSTRTRLPASRDAPSAATSSGWVAYVPLEREGTADLD